MESFKKLPKLSTLLWVVMLGALTGVGIYQASLKGYLKLPTYSGGLPLPAAPLERTQTVVSEESAVIKVVENVSPSVVAIGVTRRVYNPFDPFSLPTNQSSTIGTGFVVSKEGIIVTNKHVVSDGSSRYTVISKDGKKYEARKIYRDPILDLAVVKVDASDLSPLELGDSSRLKVGQSVVAIGNALGKFTNTVTVGVVSGLGRRVVAGDPFSSSYESLDDLIQTDAAINPGNSGGPLLNLAGQVVGVNVATTEGAQNIGFAIPINSVKNIVDEFIQKGTVSRPFLGVRYKFISRDLAVLNEVPQGAYVQEVVEGSAAEKAGIEAGDIITKMEGEAVDKENKISEVISAKKIGDSISITVWREGKEKQSKATLQELPNE